MRAPSLPVSHAGWVALRVPRGSDLALRSCLRGLRSCLRVEAKPLPRSRWAHASEDICPLSQGPPGCLRIPSPTIPIVPIAPFCPLPPSQFGCQSLPAPLAFVKLFPLQELPFPIPQLCQGPTCPSLTASMLPGTEPVLRASACLWPWSQRVSAPLRLQPDPHSSHGGHQHPHRGGGCQQEFPG